MECNYITCRLNISTRPELAAAGPGTAGPGTAVAAVSSPNIADSSSTTVASEIQNVPQVRSTCRKTDSEIQSAVKYLVKEFFTKALQSPQFLLVGLEQL